MAAHRSLTHARTIAPRWIALLLGGVAALGCGMGAGLGSEEHPPSAAREIPFDADRAWADLERIVALGPRPVASEPLERLRQLIETELLAAGLQSSRQTFEAQTPLGATAMANVIADIPGRPADGAAAPIVILCTHIDTKIFDYPFVGANDGGSGTAVLLELARGLAATAPHPVAYRLVFLDGEEAIRPQWRGLDNTYGSRHYAEALLQSPEYPLVRACVLLDLVGDRDLQLTRDTNSDRQLLGFFFDAARAGGLGQHVGARAQAVSDDHLSFMRSGIPSCDLIDLEFGPNNEYWHSPEDTLENCSRESLGAIGRIVVLGLPALERWALGRD